MASFAPAAYHHAGEADAPIFLLAYPNKAGTKLDSCSLCHSGGSYHQRRKDYDNGQLPVVSLQVRL